MKEFDYVPKKFAGKVRLKIPSYRDRMKLAQEMSVPKSEGGIDISAGAKAAEKLLDKLSELIVSIDVEYKGEKFTSLEDLEYYEEGNELIGELGHVVLNGLSLGES